MSVTGPSGAPSPVDTQDFQPEPPAEAPPPPPPPPPPAAPPPTAPPRDLGADVLANQLDQQLASRQPETVTIPESIKDPLEYGVLDSDVTDADTRKVLDVMQPMEIGSEWDDMVVAMARSSDPCYLDRLTENLCESDNQGQLERFVGWATDERCSPFAKAEIAESLAKQAIDDRPGARDALTRVLKSDPPGSAVQEMSDGELATVAHGLVASGADLAGVLAALPEDQRARLSEAIGKGAAAEFHKELETVYERNDVTEITDKMANLPFGPFDDAVQEMAKNGDLHEYLSKMFEWGLPDANWDKLKGWIADPKCDPATKDAVLGALARRAAGAGPYSQAETGARKALEELAQADPEGVGRAVATNPALAADRWVQKAVGKALTPAVLGSIMEQMRADGEFTTEEQDALGSFMHEHLQGRAGKDMAKAGVAAKEFLEKMSECGLEATPENSGLVMGAITSGLIKYMKEVKADIEQTKDLAEAFLGAGGSLLGYSEKWGNLAGAVIEGMQGLAKLTASDPEYNARASKFIGAYHNWLEEKSDWKGGSIENRQQRDDAVRAMQRMLSNNGCAFGVG